MQRFTRDTTQLFFDPGIDPIGTVSPGESFIVETADSICGLIKSEADVIDSFDDLLVRLGGACPVTGPIAVSGAAPGDVVAVTVEHIDPAPVTGRGWTSLIGGWGGLTGEMGYTVQDPLEPRTVMADVGPSDVSLTIDGHPLRLPTRPFLGTIGVAPKRERRMTLSQSREYLGDVDLPAFRAGTTMLLQANVEGAMVSMGDAHATQGDGEITGVAVEIEADVRLHIDVLHPDEAGYGRFPILEDDGSVGVVVGQMGVPLTDCVRAGYVDLVDRLVRHHGYSREGAYMLLGQVGKVEVGNMITPFYSCRVSIPRTYLDG